MAEKIDLTRPRAAAKARQVATYGTQTPLSSTAVERGRTRWLGGSTVVIQGLLDASGTVDLSGSILISGTTNITGPLTIAGATNITGNTSISGTLDVTGPTSLGGDTDITGTLDVTGQTTLGGDTEISGELDVTGPTTLGGDTEISGELDVTGPTTLGGDTEISADLELVSGGMFKAGSVEINPDGSAEFGQTTIDTDGVVKTGQMELRPDAGGQLAFANGSLTSDPLGTVLNTTTTLQLVGSSVQIAGGNLRLREVPTAASGTTSNVYIDGSGRIYRTA